MEFKQRTLMQIADMICGNYNAEDTLFVYRSSSRPTEFFQDCETDYVHGNATRNYWVADCLKDILAQPQAGPNIPPDAFARVINTLMDPTDAMHEGTDRPGALAMLNAALTRERFEAFYAEGGGCLTKFLADQPLERSTKRGDPVS